MARYDHELMQYLDWANAVFFHAWGKSPVKDHEEMRSRVGHLVGVQEGFLAVLTAQPVKGPPSGPPPAFDELRQRAIASQAALQSLTSSIDEARLAEKVRIPWFPDPPCEITIGEALLQVAMHSQHHRGQLMTRLKDHGGEPKNVDWIIWLWKGRPQARWD